MEDMVWWAWPLIMFGLTFCIGIFSVLGGVGGGVLFVPIVSGFFPIHFDFVRATGLLCALTSSLFAGPHLMKQGFIRIRLILPPALIVSVCAIIGAHLGFQLPVAFVQLLLGIVVLAITIFMFVRPAADNNTPKTPDLLSATLSLSGVYHDASLDEDIAWNATHTWQGLLLFIPVGLLGGMFGLGAGWANVPILNMLMGLPVKVAVASSGAIVSVGSSSALWIYAHKGSLIPLIAVPSVLGMSLGARLGAKLLSHTKPKVIRYIVLSTLFLAGARALWKAIILLHQ